MTHKQMLLMIDRELSTARGLVGRLEQARAALSSFNGRRRRGARVISIAARRRIGDAQRARWAKWHREQAA